MIQHTFTSEAEVLRKTQVADTSGGFVDSYASAGTYACSFAKTMITPLERERDVRMQSISYWQFVFAAGTDIRLTDRLLVGTRTFEVSGAGEISLAIMLRVNAKEIQ